MRLRWIEFFVVLLAVSVVGTACHADDRPRPNILWLSCEDISPHLGCYGDPHAITPHLDRLATEGVRYTHAFTAAGVCAPCRSTIITGMYQNSIGTHHMRCNATLPTWLRPFPTLLRDADYYCTNNSKTDYQFNKPSSREIWDESSRQAHWKNRDQQNRPFFAVFNFTGCHESGIAGAAKYRQVTARLKPQQRQDPTQLTTLPPYYPDTPVTREDWKRNYELITAMDAWAGDLIAELKAAGEYENTIIFFWSDHGVGLPRAKRWLYDSGTRIPMIVRIPQQYRVDGQGSPGTIDEQLVNSTDFGPTVLNLAGVDVPQYFQGRAFLGRDLGQPRKYAYGARDRMDERYDIIRAVRDSRYRYIRNFEPTKPYYQYMNTPEQGATMREIRRVQAAGEMTDGVALYCAPNKPPEELYDLKSDPHEMNNLAQSAQHQAKLIELRAALKAWQNEVGDIGLIPEAEIEIQEQAAGSRFAILNRDGGTASLQRLVNIATMASQGIGVLDELIKGLSDPDPAVRYWSATGIGNIGSTVEQVGPAAEQAESKVIAALDDSSPSVRIAAARATALLGHPERALATLRAELRSEHQWGRLAAAIVLDEMDQAAEPAVDALREALKNQPNKYIVRVANRALNELLDTQHQVP